ncbi:anthranilate phosphoribosyltransferase [Moraxella nasovis]|uniref:anthranilate phosphoribosyltransferase n=1 Tax=Moraxella nasovis TaxID=2904121 RepID=UPI0035CCD904
MNTAHDILNLSDDEISQILTTALDKLLNNIDLDSTLMRQVMLIIMQGRCPDALMGAILVALRIKGETIDEITACASVMIELADKITLPSLDYVVDIVGTGGDGANLFNISTACAFVAAAAGVTIAKHGNRGVSTRSGSSDLLEQAGIALNLDKSQTLECITKQGIGFLFAPNYHAAMKHAIGVRRQLKARTIFNILGPLTNPAGVKNAVIGTFSEELCEPLAHVFRNLGANHVIVASSHDGLDEFSLAEATYVAELKNGKISTYNVSPEDFGINSQTLNGLKVHDSSESLTLIRAALAGKSEDQTIKKAQDILAINAGAAIYVSGLADSHTQGVLTARRVIESGKALVKLDEYAKFTQSL